MCELPCQTPALRELSSPGSTELHSIKGEIWGQCSQPAPYWMPSLLPTRVVVGCFLMVFWLLNAFLISEQFWDLMGETEGKGNVWEPKSGIEILFWFRVLEPIPCLICTYGGFLFDTGTKEGPWRHGLVTKEVSPTMVICIHSWNPDEDLLFVCFPLKSNPIVFVFKICTHLYNNLYLVVFGTIREKNFGFRPSCNFYIIVLFLFLK